MFSNTTAVPRLLLSCCFIFIRLGIEAVVARHCSGLERLETGKKVGESFVDSGLLWQIVRKRVCGRDIVRRWSAMYTEL